MKLIASHAFDFRTEENETANPDKDLEDEILRKPVLNKATVKLALDKSKKRVAFIHSQSVENALQTYPF